LTFNYYHQKEVKLKSNVTPIAFGIQVLLVVTRAVWSPLAILLLYCKLDHRWAFSLFGFSTGNISSNSISFSGLEAAASCTGSNRRSIEGDTACTCSAFSPQAGKHQA